MKTKLLAWICCLSACYGASAKDGQIAITGATTITEPGSYVLVNDLVVDFSRGIHIAASNVKVDLNGFTVRLRLVATAFADGISIAPEIKNIEVTNGAITGFTRHGIFVPGAVPGSRNIRLSHLRISDNGAVGISMEGNPGFIIEDNLITGNRIGIYASAAGLMLNNVIGGNANKGLMSFSSELGYRSNVFYSNVIDVEGTATNLGNNLCSGVLCSRFSE
jgi:hypothetical protein